MRAPAWDSWPARPDYSRIAAIPRRDAADQSTAADRDEHGFQARLPALQLAPERALSSEDLRVVIGMDLERTGLLRARRSSRRAPRRTARRWQPLGTVLLEPV